MNKQLVPDKVQERLFNAILKRSDNQECADCTAKGPRWVSLDFGVFICMNCAGAHRKLGPTFTRVRSTKLDGWQQENIDIMENIGNGPANSYWENQIPKSQAQDFKKQMQRKPPVNATLEELQRFVQEKYVKKLYVPHSAQEPKAFYLQNNKQLKPFYFEEYSTSDTQQSQEQQKPQLGDLIEMEDDEFQEYKQSSCLAQKDVHQFDRSDAKSNQAEQGPQSSSSLSPSIQDKKRNVQHQAISFPSLDILTLYSQQSYPQHSQQQISIPNKSNYAFLSSMGQQQQQQQYYQQQYQQQQQPMGNNMNQVPVNKQVSYPPQVQNSGPVDIMQLYGQPQQNSRQLPHSFTK